MVTLQQKIVSHLWFDKEAKEAAEFYCSIFPASSITHVNTIKGTPSGDCEVISFTLAGQVFMAISAGPYFKFNESISFIVHCDTQEEIDYYWSRLSFVPEAEQCGWIKDRYGLSWQIVPTLMNDVFASNKPALLDAVLRAVLSMKKIDLAVLTEIINRDLPMPITVETLVAAPIEKVWHAYNTPEHIIKWNAASDDWYTTASSVDLREGGQFSSRMEAKDGSFGFDFAGTYTKIIEHELIEYSFGERTAQVTFSSTPAGVKIQVSFEAEETHSIEQQQQGWQAILNNFARYVEALNSEQKS